jgi:AraC-like DNA-binding protein
MFLVFQHRPSSSPYIDRVWRSHSTGPGTLLSVAATHCELVVTRHQGRLRVTLRGPETRPSTISCPADAEWSGIRLATGVYLPHHPAASLLDRQDLDLPLPTRRTFWLDGSAWELPSFDDAESLVDRLARAGLLARDPAVAAAMTGDDGALSRRRTAQRHFLLATGMTHRTWRQIQRARHAAILLRSGASIAEAVHRAGYYDQAHLTRSLRRRIGTTPARIQRQEQQLSFLYKTPAWADATLVGLQPGARTP